MENNLIIEFIPYHSLKNFKRDEKIRKIIEKIKDDRLLLIEGILDESEKKELIIRSMEEFNFKFKGIEIETIISEPDSPLERLKFSLIKIFYRNRIGLTIIGPASIVKEIKKHPNQLKIYMSS